MAPDRIEAAHGQPPEVRHVLHGGAQVIGVGVHQTQLDEGGRGDLQQVEARLGVQVTTHTHQPFHPTNFPEGCSIMEADAVEMHFTQGCTFCLCVSVFAR